MSSVRCVTAVMALTAVLPGIAAGAVSVSPTTSYNGSYTVSWTDDTSVGRVYLVQTSNGVVTKYTVTNTYSRSFSGMAAGTYGYYLQFYLYEPETARWYLDHTSSSASVAVVSTPPGTPGAVTGPPSSTTGSYAISWSAASGYVERYELQENGAVVYSGTALGTSVTGRGEGTYRYKARACNQLGCSAFTAELAVTVAFATLTELAPDHLPVVQPVVPAQGWVGTIRGNASVHGGAATYRVDIEVPPGRAGMQPEIALTYSSRNGNGIAGVGWSLSGLSTIYRCPRTLAQDGGNAPVHFDMTDRFCFDGRRLVAPPLTPDGQYAYSSEFRTETDPFDRVTQLGTGASNFKVEHKSGRISTYARATTMTAWPDKWLLLREEDRQGNRILYNWTLFASRNGGKDAEWVLSSIDYTVTDNSTLNPDARHVVFEYTADREDRRTTFLYGVGSISTARLSAIVTKVGTQLVRRYELAYRTSAATRRSLLESITVCAATSCAMTSEKLPSTRFTYQEEPGNFVAERFADPQNPGTYLGTDWHVRAGADYDGDGQRDVFYLTSLAPGDPRLLCLTAYGICESQPAGNPWFPGFDNGIDANPEHGAADVNNDGRTDLVGTQDGYLAFGGRASDGWRIDKSSLPLSASPTAGANAAAKDYDGDGLVDVETYDSTTDQYTIYPRLRNYSSVAFGAGTVLPAIPVGKKRILERDLDGDGHVDFVIDLTDPGQPTQSFPDPPGQTTSVVLFRQGQSYVEIPMWQMGGPGGAWDDTFVNHPNRRWIDVNGDGLIDIYEPGSLWINRGGAAYPMFQRFNVIPWATPDESIRMLRDHRTFVMDVDSDGSDELMLPGERTLAYCARVVTPDGHDWYCGNEFDNIGAAYEPLDKSVFRWDAYKFRQVDDTTYEMVRMPTSLRAPVSYHAPDDYYGDGMPDVYYRLLNSTSTQSVSGIPVLLGYYQGVPDDQLGPYLARNHAKAPDLLVGVTNGLGAAASWQHQPLSKKDVQGCDVPGGRSFYVANLDAPRSPGYVYFASSMWVVSKHTVDNGLGTSANPTCYRYEDAMLNVEGRGFQGFKKIVAEEQLSPAVGEDGAGEARSRNNLRTTTEFHQEFPLTNRVKRITVARVGTAAVPEVLLGETTYWWRAAQNGWGASVVYPSATVEEKYDLVQIPGAGPLIQTTHVTELDAQGLDSGEAWRTCAIVKDETTTTIAVETRQLENDTSAWWLGRVRSRNRVADFFTGSFDVSGSPPFACPTFTASSNAKVQDLNYQWYSDADPAGYRRKLKSEELVLRGTSEALTSYPAGSGYDSYGNVTTKQVTARGIVDGVGNPAVLSSTYSYTADGYFAATQTNPVGHVATIVTDPGTGAPTYHQDVQYGPATRTSYDSLGRVLDVTHDGQQTQYERLSAAACGDAVLARQTLQAGAPAHTEYVDRLGRVLATETGGFDGRKISSLVEYNERGVKITEYPPWEAAACDLLAMPQSRPPYATRYSQLDALGRVGQKTVTRDPALFATGKGEQTFTTTYVHEGLKTTIHALKAGGAGELLMSRTYDGRGKLVETMQQVTSPNTHQIVTHYSYDPAGALTHIVDAAGNDIAATYDDAGRKLSVNDPDRGNWTYAWDGLGRLVTRTDARGVITRNEYDGVGRILHRFVRPAANAAEALDASWYYDQDGKYGTVAAVENADGFRRDYKYDSLSRPYRVTTRVPKLDQGSSLDSASRTFTIDYGYDRSYGWPKAIRYPSAEAVSIARNDRGYVTSETQLSLDGVLGTQYRRVNAMSARGQVTDEAYGNGTSDCTHYEASSGLAIYIAALRGTCLSTDLIRQVDYAHDHFLNLDQQKKNFPGGQATESYTYDELQRIKSASRAWAGTGLPATGEQDTYGYDDLGNLTWKSDYGSSYTYGSGSRLLRLAGAHAVASVLKNDGLTATFSYDANGNMIGGDGRTLTFDLLDRPVQVVRGGVVTDFLYAPDGARYRQRTSGPTDPKFGAKTVYYLDKDYELVVWDAPLATEERTYLGDSVVVYRRDAGAREVRYLHKDRLGSVDAVTDASSAVISTDVHGYDPWGKPRAGNWTPSGEQLHPAGDLGATTDRGFTGHEHLDNLYLVHMNGRVYDYRIGRFLSVDPIISDPANSQSINPYSYIGNNPLSGVDPTGYNVELPTESSCRSYVCNAPNIGSAFYVNGVDQNAKGPANIIVGSGFFAAGGQGQGMLLPTANLTKHGSPQDTSKGNDTSTLSLGDWSTSDSSRSGSVGSRTSSNESSKRSRVDLVREYEEFERRPPAFAKEGSAAAGWFAGKLADPGTTGAMRALMWMGLTLSSFWTEETATTTLMAAGIRVGGKPPEAGGGATVENIPPGEAVRIQNAATRLGLPISVVGSRARGTARPDSDWDYVIQGNHHQRNSAASSLPGAKNISEGLRRNQDIFKEPLDRSRPHVTFHPE